MPHLIVEYSANLEAELDLQTLINRLHDTAIATGVFPVGGTRTRAVRREIYRIADGDPSNGFVNLVARIGHGRSPAVKRQAGEQLFQTLCTHLDALYQKRPLAISFEIQEIDPQLSFKKNNIHEKLNKKKRL